MLPEKAPDEMQALLYGQMNACVDSACAECRIVIREKLFLLLPAKKMRHARKGKLITTGEWKLESCASGKIRPTQNGAVRTG